jgi:fatty aldehyde-generating acyl-ACP reductase
MLPYLTNEAPWFSFLVHARDPADFFLVGGSSIIASHSATQQEFITRMCTMPPTVIGTVRVGLGPVWGEVIAVVRLPGDILRPSGRAQITQAVLLAAQRGSAVVGLGALTAPATRGGTTLLPELPKGLTLTTGNAYTAAIAEQNVTEAAAAIGLGTNARVIVVGATGSVGVAASHLLADAGFDLVLAGRTRARVERELGGLAGAATLSAGVADVPRADIVLLLTSDTSSRLTPEMPRPGAIVIDFAQPVNVDPARYPEFAARDVHVVQGGLVTVPGLSCTVDMRLADGNCTLACLAETYLLAREGIRTHSVGNARPEAARHMLKLAARHGFSARQLGIPARGPTRGPGPDSGTRDTSQGLVRS